MEISQRRALERTAIEVRKDVVRMIGVARSGYVASSLSAVDILVFMYWRLLNIRPEEPRMYDRDRMVLSKGHACPALYAVLANRGFFDRKELWNFRRLGSMLQGHPETPRTPGIDAPGGSLGMGLGLSNGVALALRLDGVGSRVFCLLGDGELQEGAVWESAMQTANLGLGGVTAIVDLNGIQMDGKVVSIKKIEPVKEKFESFGWRSVHADGHDMEDLERAFSVALSDSIPSVILAETIPGKGFSMAEKGLIGSSRPLDREMMEQALRELESATKSFDGEEVR
ncbi:MAG: transketolase [Thermovirgaceae bacterium]|nr:transketolase [Thermovirgaceae bacterium]